MASAAVDCVFAPPPTPTLAVAGSAARFPVRRVYCVGRNYWDHGVEMGGDPEREPPFFFAKPADAATDVSAEGAVVPYPTETADLHHEIELVVAIGGTGQNVTVDDARRLVWGYGVGIDLTRRDLQAQAKAQRRPWDAAKGFDASAPVGKLVPAEQVSLDEKSMLLLVNGGKRQETALSKMIWSIPEQVSRLSALFKLEPGDLLFTGTPAGVAALQPGDTVQATVEGLPPCSFTVGPAP
eukprot:TRINITY_DN47533_c0_g1_i1.p2 TRINITY_DN47533_c0_g1~~TRINITY_DN47533_c0_g1_i1.p2  ORF type:complete len:267 (+),score=99.44 TRINITY_DN47533_c0_g1_i1:87-803(+)